MTMIIKGAITKLMKGYPVDAQRYDVKGAILDGTKQLSNGQLVKYTNTTGYYQAVDTDQTISAADDIAGFKLAVNVQLLKVWPGNGQEVKTDVHEAFDLCVRGLIAVPVSFSYTNDNEGETTNRDAAFAKLQPNKKVYATTAGVITTDNTAIDIDARFLGIIENVVEEVGDSTTTVTCLAAINYRNA